MAKADKNEYRIYASDKWETLENNVTAALKRGATCQGGVCVIVDDGKRVYMQAMILPAEE